MTDATKDNAVKAEAFYRNHKKDLLMIIWSLFVAAFMCFILKTARMDYETSDDLFMMQLLMGVFGTFSAYNVFNNIVFSGLLSLLSTLIPGVNFCGWLYIIFIFASYEVLGIVLIKRSEDRDPFYLLLPLLFMLATFDTLIVRFNYSKIGAVAFIVGFLTVMVSDNREGKKTVGNNILNISGYILLIGGALIRREPFMACLPFAIVMAAYMFIKNGKRFIPTIIRLSVSLALIAVLWMVNHVIYHTGQLKDYSIYYDICLGSQDYYGLPDYETYKEEYDMLGLNEHDQAMLASYLQADRDVFSNEVLIRLDDLAKEINSDSHRLTPGFMKELIRSVFKLGTQFPQIYVIMILFCFSCAVGDRRHTYISFLGIALFFGELLYLTYEGRILERSILVSCIGALAMIVFFLSEGIYENIDRRVAFNVVITSVLIYTVFTMGFSDIRDIPRYEIYKKADVSVLDAELSKNTQNLYIWDFQSYADASFGYASPVEGYPVNWMGNSVVLGAWPYKVKALDRLVTPFGNPDNLFLILAENPNAYFVYEKKNPMLGNLGPEVMKRYINDHYNPDAVPVITFETDEYVVMSFSR